MTKCLVFFLQTCLYGSFLLQTRQAQEDALTISRRLPHDSALLVSIPNSGKRLDLLISRMLQSPESVDVFFDLLQHTNWSDGTELDLAGNSESQSSEQRDSMESVTDFVRQTKSIHFVTDSWRAKIGDWAILIELPENARQIELQSCVVYSRFWLRFLALLGDSRYMHSSSPAKLFSASLTSEIGKWETTVSVRQQGRWICVGSTDDHCQRILTGITESTEQQVQDSLFARREFKYWIANTVPNVDVQMFLLTSDAVKLLEGFQYVRGENAWRSDGYNETPWFGYWWQWHNDRDEFVIEQVRNRAATSPPSGLAVYWPSFKKLDEFLPVPDDAVSVSGRHLDLVQWNDIASREFDVTSGEGSFQRYQNNTLVAFRNGSLRPMLGHVQFEYVFNPERNMRRTQLLSVYKVEPSASRQVIEQQISRYYEAMNEQAKRASFDANYEQRTIDGRTAWWTEHYRTDPEIKRFLQERGTPFNEAEESATGAIFFGDYLVSGREDIIRQVVDWSVTAELQVNGTTEYIKPLKALSDRYGVPDIHSFRIDNSEKVTYDILQFGRTNIWNHLPLPSVNAVAREYVEKNPELLKRLSHTQRIALLRDRFYEYVSQRDPKYFEIEGYDVARTRKTSVHSWRFRN